MHSQDWHLSVWVKRVLSRSGDTFCHDHSAETTHKLHKQHVKVMCLVRILWFTFHTCDPSTFNAIIAFFHGTGSKLLRNLAEVEILQSLKLIQPLWYHKGGLFLWIEVHADLPIPSSRVLWLLGWKIVAGMPVPSSRTCLATWVNHYWLDRTIWAS